MNPAVLAVIQEARLSSFVYPVPEDRQHQMYDFYIMSFLAQYLSGKGKQSGKLPMDVGVEFALKEARSTLYDKLQEDFLRIVFRAVTGEMRHIWSKWSEYDDPQDTYDILQADADVTDNEIQMLKNFLRMMDGQHGDDIHRPLAADIGEKLFNKSDKARKWMNLASKTFAMGDDLWNEEYGSKSWKSIADAWPKLKGAETPQNQQVWIDHIYDLQHNTGSVLNKDESFRRYDLESKEAHSIGFGWIKKALDHKRDAKSPHDLFDNASPAMRRLGGFVLKEMTGASYQGWKDEQQKDREEAETLRKKTEREEIKEKGTIDPSSIPSVETEMMKVTMKTVARRFSQAAKLPSNVEMSYFKVEVGPVAKAVVETQDAGIYFLINPGRIYVSVAFNFGRGQQPIPINKEFMRDLGRLKKTFTSMSYVIHPISFEEEGKIADWMAKNYREQSWMYAKTKEQKKSGPPSKMIQSPTNENYNPAVNKVIREIQDDD